MSINFCDAMLQPGISSRAITVDGHEITNLVSSLTARNKGFLVETYLKPPVIFTLKFPVNIAIERVVMCLAVGCQRSCSIELYTHCENRPGTWLTEVPSSNGQQIAGDDDKYRVFNFVGRAEDVQSRYLSGVNCLHRRHRDLIHSHSLPRRMVPEDSATIPLKGTQRGCLTNVSHLRVRITRTAHSSTCAMGWIEVWGDPLMSCPKPHMDIIHHLCHKLSAKNTALTSKTNDEPPSKNLDAVYTQSDIDSDNLPEEFLDPLTNEMLLMPVLLPCGKTIDQSSLDKHTREQAQWGRPPSDPFTGIVFSERSKPLPNNPLKARMDRFLLNQPNLARIYDFRVGRTGVTLPTPQVTQSSLVAERNIVKSSEHSGVKRSLDHIENPPSKILRGADSSPSEEIVSGIQLLSRKKSLLSRTGSANTDPGTNIRHTNPGISAVRHNNPSTGVAETRTNKDAYPSSRVTDLDIALKQTLAGLPSFLNRPPPPLEPSGCVYCSNSADRNLMYKLQCAHVVCRTCLLKRAGLRVLQCTQCQEETERMKVVKAQF